jgi:hypothetical protein
VNAVDSAQYLHHWLIAVFLFLFALMSFIGMIRLIREGRYFGVILLLLATLLFGYSTWIAATLQV